MNNHSIRYPIIVVDVLLLRCVLRANRVTVGTLLKGAAQRANDNYGEAVPFVATVMEDLDLLRSTGTETQ